MVSSGIFGLPVVAAGLTNPIPWKRLLVYPVFSKSIHLRCSSLLYSIKLFCGSKGDYTVYDITFRNIWKYSCTFLSVLLPRNRGWPAFFFDSTTSVGGSGRSFNTDSYLARKALAVRSPHFKCWCVFLNFHTAFVGPYKDAYFSIRKRSLSVKEL